MKTWTVQEYYDRLYEAAYDGTFPSYTEDPSYESGIRCLYRGEGKHRCAIGLLLPDANYDEDFDNNPVGCYQLFRRGLLEEVEGLGENELDRIQEAHDDTIRELGGWSASAFLKKLNSLSCFEDIEIKEPKHEAGGVTPG